MTSQLTAITDSLDHVTGGRDEIPPAPSEEQQRQWGAHERCMNWAKGPSEGSPAKVEMCDREFVRRNWDLWGAEAMQ